MFLTSLLNQSAHLDINLNLYKYIFDSLTLIYVSKFCEIFVADYFSQSDGGQIFLFLWKHAFKPKTSFGYLKKKLTSA